MDHFQAGRQAAKELSPVGSCSGRAAAHRLRRSLAQVERARARLAAAPAQGETPAGEWLLDNAWLAQREGGQAQSDLRRGKRLRQCGGLLYVEALALRVRAECPLCIPEELSAFLAGVQGEQPLTEMELSLFIPALKGALCSRLAQLCIAGEEAPGPFEEVFTALRTLSGANLGPMLERASAVETVLSRDPAGIYPQMAEETRAHYRRQVCVLARREGLGEQETAQRALALAQAGEGPERHVGWFLFRKPLGREERKAAGALYVGAILLPTLVLALWLGFRLNSPALFFLLLLPASDLCKNVADFLALRLVHPRPVAKMALKEGVPPQGRTLCVICGLLTGEDSGGQYAALLERYRLANRDAGEELSFGLLADLRDSARPMGESDRRWVKGAQKAIDALNAKYGGGFYLFFRSPVFQTGDERYVGWERKRGALIELTRLLRRRATSLRVLSGEARALAGTKYVITLDSDTSLNVGSARELIGAMLHPLNRPVVDRRRRVVTQGYGLLQPRIGVELRAANRSQFARVFAGLGGIDPYGGACSDVYHDLFDRGSYTGKGIFDVEAFARCLDGRFPDGRILSHDLLEGAYLHAGLLGDVELTDGYPYKVSSYFSRLHRWVRGDWQLLPWLGRRVRDEGGEKVPNPISPMDKWKILDNLRRSLSPIFTLTALILGMCSSTPAFTAAGTLAVLSAWSNLLLSGAGLAFRGGVGAKRRYHSTVVAGLGGTLLQTLLQLLFLPYQAWICLSAILTALWRSLVSHRRLLEWVTAADAERKTDSLWANFRAQWSAVAVGCLCMALAGFPAGNALGLIWAASPAFAWSLSKPVRRRWEAPAADRPFLLHQAGLIWRYFEDWLRPEDHWLPPDNVQEKPALGPARRTSPTNMGMALLSCVAAADLELTGRKKAAALIGRILTSIESLEKWKGHLYNWYDTALAKPLWPRYVSTVDSGNLRGCLFALKAALLEWGEEDLARRAGALAGAMDLSALYDKGRKLFYIGFDAEQGSFTPGWYDLMASEARLTSYLAVALGEVEPRHWRRPGRMLAGENDYCGMVSWSGTMFEYFMPNLLLPSEEGSLMYESLAFCVYAQKRRGAKAGVPWGISESGFFAFDPGMAYQYKAHGVQSLGLKRGLDDELVVAPYASFLALLLAPRSAARNLRRLRDLGLEGTYGLCEAADFTPQRLHQGEPFAPVWSFMVHHLGMSLLAIDNVLRGGIMQERFLRESALGAFRELLQEKVPVGEPIRRIQGEVQPQRQGPARRSQLRRTGEGFGLARPACHLLTNGLVTALCTDAGAAELTDDRGETPVLTCFRERYAPAGALFFLRGPDGALKSLTAAPFYPENWNGAWGFDGAGAEWALKEETFTAALRFHLPAGERGALWSLELQGLRGYELVAYLEPVLLKKADYQAHPAYAKQAIQSTESDRGITFTRRPGREERSPALAVAWDGHPSGWDTSRETALGRGGLRRLSQSLIGPSLGTQGAVVDPCLLVRFPVDRDRFRLRLALGFEENAPLAERTAQRALRAPQQSIGGLDGQLRALQMTAAEGLRAMDLLSILAFPGKRQGEVPQSALWPYGISGDHPIALAHGNRQGEDLDTQPLKFYALLTRCGFLFDLVFLLRDGGDYRRPQRAALTRALKDLGLEPFLGKKGGIHLVDASPETAAVLRAWAAAELDSAGRWEDRRDLSPAQPPLLPLQLNEGPPRWSFRPKGEFALHLSGDLPAVGWSHYLVNPRFGWLTDETGCGHLWRENAREGQLTPWNNDPLAIGGPERFLLTLAGETHSLFADGDGLPTVVTYGFGWARWERTWPAGPVTVTAWVPWEGERRLLLIEGKGKGELLYSIDGRTETRFPFSGRLLLVTDPRGTGALSPEDLGEEDGLALTQSRWRELVQPLRVETPDPALDHYLNGWCLYQVMACRLLGRTSRYQNGGAYGFRDQLQDVLALRWTSPERTREHILRCCAHQFPQGDVQHWWHEVGEERARGVRTRISDDLLWLPYVLAQYVETWGDYALLDVQVPYLSGAPLEDGELQRYFSAGTSPEGNTVYGHALNAIRCALERGVGDHGLMKMGAGDWNDGMDRVGVRGQGESVWLTWFTATTLTCFIPLARRVGDAEAAGLCRDWAAALGEAAENAWDGKWYLRGWYDDGAPLGSHTCQECRIDSIAQSWAALSGMGSPDRVQEALLAAQKRLVETKDSGVEQAQFLVKVLSPPFDGAEDPGYIRAYPPGVRENGGQYTHAALWLALALFRAKMPENGYEILKNLLPETHNRTVYKAEPYVLPADVCANPQHFGRAGWTWYTGAAGWYFQTAFNALFGAEVREGHLTVRPSIPAAWPGCSLGWKGRGWTLDIRISRGKKAGMRLDGRPVPSVPLDDLEGEHILEVTVCE